MNRQQRRAGGERHDPTSRYQARVAAEPRDAKARNELACALLAQGNLAQASQQFACALSLMPELLEQYEQIVATLLQVIPALRGCIARLARGSPPLARVDAWLPRGDFSAIARDPLLRT